MKQLKRKTLLVALLIISMQLPIFALDIWVSPNGNDQNQGTQEQPLQSIAMAQRIIRNLRRLNDPSLDQGVKIIVENGRYQLLEPLNFRPEDAGTESSPTIIEAAPNALPSISGGVVVQNWSKAGKIKGIAKNAQGKIWVAEIPRMGGHRIGFRQLWVNNAKAIRASNLNDGALDRILSVNKQKESFWIPKPETTFDETDQLELVIHQWWAIAILRVKDIQVAGDSALITFHQPESRIEFEHPWPAPFIDEKKELNGNSAFYFVNHKALLNQPGEWYADEDAGKLYYWPRENENMSTAEVVVPYLETLVKIAGTADQPVSNIQFKGITFEHAGWMRPSLAGHVPLQAGFYCLDAYKLLQPGTADKAGLENQAWIGRQSAGIELNYASGVHFENCTIQHMAATGIDFVEGTNNNLVQGCTIQDIGGTGLQIGFFGTETYEAHLPYNPVDARVVCNNETIINNLITDCTNEDWGCVGISVGYAHDITIEHNEVSYLNYSGICVGWGWTKTINCMKNNRVHANYIHHFAKNMYDVGGVYTLSAQTNSEISENRIEHLLKAPYAHIPEHYQYIYLDEGSSFIKIENNWTEKDKFFSNTPGPGNEWINNGPQVSDSIRNAAGRINLPQ
ncbi:MAG: right-handed parallel beta-helix repeat-containing protein [Prolixibacteraceae bacterium]